MDGYRGLSDKEYHLVVDLIAHSKFDENKRNYLINSIRDVMVEEMSDGGMGSLRFLWFGEQDRRFGSQLSEREYQDSDGVKICASLNLDQQGDLFELDIWKVDFSKLKEFPSP
ncbi:hypothetical protein PFI31113_04099 [Pandoraea fibrosis]|uniref:DUF6984 domain-containing protein n=2 Tax=Pandoraea fibrosis TaxID=1891094 RepID=A0A5E4XW07_9BURK|nr:hypothetical protein PFI31113_04099 [Pandoraea fibrosis]